VKFCSWPAICCNPRLCVQLAVAVADKHIGEDGQQVGQQQHYLCRSVGQHLCLRRISNELFTRVCVVIEVALHYGSPMQAFRALGGVDGAGEDSYEATVEEHRVRYHGLY
jgi:hypothetical protein